MIIRIKTNFTCILIYSIIFFLIINFRVLAGDPPKKVDHWRINLSLSPFYDSNILKYSEKYIERFNNREDEGRFHINRIDDLTLGYSLGITFTDQIIGKQKSIFGAGLDSDAYTYNSIKSWFTYNVFWRQYVSKATSFYISYSYIPKFYVRHFRDDDWVKYYGYTPIAFKAYEFSKDDIDFWVHHTFNWKTTRIRGYFSYMKYFLDEANTEYDSDDFLFGGKIYQRLTKNLDINVAYYYITSDAKGYDEAGEIRETSDDSDATNYEHVYSLGFDFKMPKIFSLKNDISIDAQYQRAFYTTTNYVELDPLHAGRYDYNYRVFVNYSWDIFKNFSMTAFYHWMGRESSSPSDINREYISNEKDYTQYRLGVRFNYEFRF